MNILYIVNGLTIALSFVLYKTFINFNYNSNNSSKEKEKQTNI